MEQKCSLSCDTFLTPLKKHSLLISVLWYMRGAHLSTCSSFPLITLRTYCSWVWAIRLIGEMMFLLSVSLFLSLHPFITSLCEPSSAGRWVITILGGIQRQMLSHSSCRSGSECWVHLHTNIKLFLSLSFSSALFLHPLRPSHVSLRSFSFLCLHLSLSGPCILYSTQSTDKKQ